MKTKEQILDWLDKQPWKAEFYEEVFSFGNKLSYNEDLILDAFRWLDTKSGSAVWVQRYNNFINWYEASFDGKPTSWEEYCRQNPISIGECYIDGTCGISEAVGARRDVDTDANVMSKDLCEAFVAYMKLIQLRNAWVKDYENGDEDEYRKIVYTTERGFFGVRLGTTGLSFPTLAMAEEFMNTFKNLLEVAKPLL